MGSHTWLNPFKEVVTRSEYSSMFFNLDADVETNENRVLIEKKMDFMKFEFAETHSLSWNYNWARRMSQLPKSASRSS